MAVPPYQVETGRLRHRVALEAPTRSPDALNQSVPSWSPVADGVHAEVRPLHGRELWRAQQAQADVTHEVTIRYRAGVAPDWRVVHRGRVLQVLSVVDVEERRRRLTLACVEVVK